MNKKIAVIIPTRGLTIDKKKFYCNNCGVKNEHTEPNPNGISHQFIEGFDNMTIPEGFELMQMFVSGLSVADAYNKGINDILTNPIFSDVDYILTVEDDILIPPDNGRVGFIEALLEHLEYEHYHVAGALYFTKGDHHVPLICGKPEKFGDLLSEFMVIREDEYSYPVAECNGLGMGFTLFKKTIFLDSRLEKPYFKTEETGRCLTQDLYFFNKIRKLGYRVCVDTSIRVGHLDIKTDIIY